MRRLKSFWAEKGRVQAWYQDTEGHNDGPISYPKCVVWDPNTDEVVYSSVMKDSTDYETLLQEAKNYYAARSKI